MLPIVRVMLPNIKTDLNDQLQVEGTLLPDIQGIIGSGTKISFRI